jgi:hydroxypyruvate isomerase
MKPTNHSIPQGITRRAALAAAALGASAPLGLAQTKAVQKGRLKQSVCRWCYRDMPLEELAAHAAAMGLVAVDLLDEAEWPVVAKHGLICSLGQGICTIPDGLNVKANHAQIEANFRRLLPSAKKHGVPNMICFSGNRRDVSDEEAWDNCALLLNNVKAQAEDLGVTIVMELLNSKVDHRDYHADRTAFGAAIVDAVGSPRFKLLYDVYHMQIMEGDVIRTIRDHIERIGHFHTAGVPGRHELDDQQELNYRGIARAIADTGFAGWVGHEFVPRRDPTGSLRQAVEVCTV